MKTKPLTFIALAALLATSAQAAETQHPGADSLLRQMSGKLAAAKRFTFKAQREIDGSLLVGRTSVPERAQISVAVERPNRLAARSISGLGERRMVADGRTLTVFDKKPNHYARVSMTTTIDGLVDQLDAKYGFTPPLAEFAISDVYGKLREQAKTITYLGRGNSGTGFLGLGGVDCHRIALKGRDADAELWIAVSDSLPRKLIATFHRQGSPRVRIAFSDWNLAAPVSSDAFSIVPPKGAEKIEMWTTSQMESSTK